jgi:hypothetical protein
VYTMQGRDKLILLDLSPDTGSAGFGPSDFNTDTEEWLGGTRYSRVSYLASMNLSGITSISACTKLPK